MRVDATVGEQAKEVHGAAPLHGGGDFAHQQRVQEELAGVNQRVDARDVHADDAARAQIEVSDLAVAHLAVREADEVVAGAECGVGVLAQKLVVGRLARLRNGVAIGFRAHAPAVEDGEDQRFPTHPNSLVVTHSTISVYRSLEPL